MVVLLIWLFLKLDEPSSFKIQTRFIRHSFNSSLSNRWFVGIVKKNESVTDLNVTTAWTNSTSAIWKKKEWNYHKTELNQTGIWCGLISITIFKQNIHGKVSWQLLPPWHAQEFSFHFINFFVNFNHCLPLNNQKRNKCMAHFSLSIKLFSFCFWKGRFFVLLFFC